MSEPLKGLEVTGRIKRQNCLAWSQDGELAIATGSIVHIRNGDWRTTSLNAGYFSEQDWMQLSIYDMAAMPEAFIGREQAEAEVVALAWSPPGIAPRFRCALTILTSNGLLSIWTMKSSHFLETKWVRQVVVNKTPGVGTERILAMAWSPVIDSRKMQETVIAAHACKETLLSKRYLLALFMEDKALKLLVSSRAGRGSFKGLPPLTTYLSSPLGYFRGAAQLNLRNFAPINPQAPLLGTAPRGIQWNEWKYCGSTYSAESDLFVRSTEGDIHCKIAVTDANGQVSYKIASSSRLPLALEVGRHQIPHNIWKGGHLVVGLPGGSEANEAPKRICIATSTYNLDYHNLVTDPTTKSRGVWMRAEGPSRMREKINQIANDFSKDFKLGGAVDVRVWGLAAHRSFLAIAITTQPKEHLFYLTSANSKLHVVFSHESLEPSLVKKPSQSATPIKFPWRIPLDMDPPTPSASLQSSKPPTPIKTISLTSNDRMNKQAIFARLCRILLQPERFPNCEGFDDLDHRAGEFITVKDPSDEIWNGWPGLKNMIQEIFSSHYSYESKMVDTGGAVECINRFIQERAVEEVDLGATPRMVEYCPFSRCHRPVFWTANVVDAYCEGKHLVVRCSRTAMALVNPYCIKRCNRCARAYLDEERIHAYYEDLAAAGAITEEQRHRTIMLEDDYVVNALEETVRCHGCHIGTYVNYCSSR